MINNLLFIVIFSTFTALKVISKTTNVALNKPAKQSSLFGSYYASRAVDGNTTHGVDLDKNSCSHTDDKPSKKQVWWQVNLQTTYSITTVAITYRNWNVTGLGSGAARLAGFSIYISDTENWWNGVRCYHDNQTALPDTRNTLHMFCYQSVSGQYVTIYNDRNITYSPLYSEKAILELCEVEIDIPSPCSNCIKASYPYCTLESQGFRCQQGCEKSFYGEDCSQNCTCHGDGSCHRNGICKTCNRGYYPSRAQCAQCDPSCGGDGACGSNGICLSCNAGKYKSGNMCITCPSNCGSGNLICNSSDGTCIHGCKDGFYGRTCNNRCMSNCDKCINANTCDKCSGGFFGANCNNRCDGCQDSSCNGDGVCIGACIAGRHGPHCNNSCPRDCGGDSISCDKLSGSCETCMGGKFGEHCTSNCSSFCGGNGTCEVKTGYCSHCPATMTGPFCEKQIQSESGVPMAAVGGGIGTLVALIIIIIVVVIILRRRKRENENSKTTYTAGKDNNVCLNIGYSSEIDLNTQSPSIAPADIPSAKTDYHNSSNDYYNSGDIHFGIACDDFKGYVTSKIADDSLIKEFDSIPYGELYPATAGRLEVNKDKNRFKTTFPYDKTRIILTQTGNSSDYINANYIHGREKEKKYIATQGPLTNTIVDFWTMVWEFNIGKIVMLTGLIEGGKNKCKKYWPDVNEHEKHGRITLSIIDERTYSYYTQREIKLEENKRKQARRIHHFHFTAWPDHDVTDPVLLVQFHKQVESKKSDIAGPLLVHCSAGIGRTGTYIGLDDLVHMAKQTNRINVKDFVKQMRDCRMNMVQKPPQYVLLHEAILEELQLPYTTIAMSDFPAEWRKIVSDKSPINQQKIRKEFERLNGMKRTYTKKDFSASTAQQNKHKNRSQANLPLDRYRPYLTKYIKGRTDYINAVVIPSHRSASGFIVTQMPVKDTVIDFWRLVHDHEITAIVHFDSDHKDKCEFYPESNSEMNNELFCIRSTSENKYDEDVNEREVVLCNKDDDKQKSIKLVSVRLGAGNLSTCIQLIKAANLVNNWQHGNNSGPCAVVSCDGTKSCDVFCAVMIAMESLSVDNEVNIFQIAHQLQIRRPGFFPDCDTYKLCYEVINHHLTSESIYFN